MHAQRTEGEFLTSDTIVAPKTIAVRAKTPTADLACLAHPRWMTRSGLVELGEVVAVLLERWEEE